MINCFDRVTRIRYAKPYGCGPQCELNNEDDKRNIFQAELNQVSTRFVCRALTAFQTNQFTFYSHDL